MWKICLTLLFLVGSTKCLEAWTVTWNQTKYELSMGQTITLRFNLSTIPVTSVYNIKTTNTNPDVVEITMEAEVVNKNETGWIGEVKLNTLFLGSANVTLILEIDGVYQFDMISFNESILILNETIEKTFTNM